MGQLKLCFVADSVSIHAQRWVNYFAGRGHDTHLISRWFPTGRERLDDRIHAYALVRLLRSSQVSRASIALSWVPWVLQVRRLVNDIQPDIVHALFLGVPGYLGVASGFHPLVLSAWGSDILIIPRRNLVSKFLSRRALKRADRILCVSPVVKDEMIRLGAAPNKIDVTPIGVDTQKFRPAARDEAVLHELDILGAPLVISTRSLKPVYDVETLIRAIPSILDDVPEAKFVVAGAGEQRGYLESLAHSLGVAASIRFAGWVPENEYRSLLASADVYVSTSLSDGTSVSLLEALACELAPVVTDIPANRPWVHDGEGGFLFPPRDHKTLASAVIRLLKDRETRIRFGRNGRDAVTGKADFEREMARVTTVYEELKSGKPQAP